jgi:hypothetical protein
MVHKSPSDMTDNLASRVLNVARITFPDVTISATTISLPTPEAFAAIEASTRGTHFIRRTTDDTAVAIPLVDNPPLLAGDSSPILLRENLNLIAALARNALTEYLSSIGRSITWARPLSFLADKRNDLLTGAGDDSSTVLPVAVLPVYKLDFRRFDFGSSDPFVGIAATVRLNRSIVPGCKELSSRGFDLAGLYVGTHAASRDPRITAEFRTMGRVKRVDGAKLILDDLRGGQDECPIDEALLDASPEAIRRVLEFALGRKAEGLLTRLRQKEGVFHEGPSKLTTLTTAIGFLQSRKLNLLPGVPFQVEPFVTKLPPLQTAIKPTYVYDPGSRQTNTWHDGGLKTFGPYTRQTFTPSRPKICVICQKSKRGRVEVFVQKFLKGIPAGGSNNAPFAAGLCGKYRLENVSTHFFSAEGDSANSYRDAFTAAIAVSTSEGFKWDLALVQVEESFRLLPVVANPYFIGKAFFLTQQVPVQDFRIETAATSDDQLQYSLNNMALATYSKMGGIPWLLKASPTVAHELVIGLGSAQFKNSRFGSGRRMVGITTVFSGDGNYRVSSLSHAADMNNYASALLTSLRATVSRIKVDMNWQARDHVRLVFHAFKPLKNIEAEAIKKLMAELGDFDIEYAFLHVVQDQPLILFDPTQLGAGKGPKKKGVYAPLRGSFMHLSPSETILALVGPSEVRRPEHGMPTPLLLRLHGDSTFSDMTYLTRQLFQFACHSWRSFFPGELPVTIKYSDLIAALLGNLSEIPTWNPEAMLGRLANTRWFL